VIFALVLTPTGLALATVTGCQAWAEARKVEAPAVVIDARVVTDERPPARAPGPWLKEWLAEYDTAAGLTRRWFPAGRFRTDREADPFRDVGQTVRVWYSPGAEGEATLDPPEVLRNVLWAGWSTVIGAAGVLSLYALVRRRPRAATAMARDS
jgi:hypothetical protein